MLPPTITRTLARPRRLLALVLLLALMTAMLSPFLALLAQSPAAASPATAGGVVATAGGSPSDWAPTIASALVAIAHALTQRRALRANLRRMRDSLEQLGRRVRRLELHNGLPDTMSADPLLTRGGA